MKSVFLLFLTLGLVFSDTYLFTEDKLEGLMAEAQFLNPFLESLINSIVSNFNALERRVKPINF